MGISDFLLGGFILCSAFLYIYTVLYVLDEPPPRRRRDIIKEEREQRTSERNFNEIMSMIRKEVDGG